MTISITSKVSVRTIQQRIKKGVAVLDSTIPSWANMIDPARLNVGNASDCIIGQLTAHLNGEKFEPMRVLDHVGFGREVRKAWNEQLGFNHINLDSIPADRNPRQRTVVQIMSACWKYHVKQRQTAEHRLKLVQNFLDVVQG